MGPKQSAAQQEVERLERRAAELAQERQTFEDSLTKAKRELAAYDSEADAILASAERAGDSMRAEIAESKLFKLQAAVRRKEAAIRACVSDQAENAAALATARLEGSHVRLAEVQQEARKITDKITLSDVQAWQRLIDLYKEGEQLLRHIRNAGRVDFVDRPFSDPHIAYIGLAMGTYKQIGGQVGQFANTSVSLATNSAREALFGDE